MITFVVVLIDLILLLFSTILFFIGLFKLQDAFFRKSKIICITTMVIGVIMFCAMVYKSIIYNNKPRRIECREVKITDYKKFKNGVIVVELNNGEIIDIIDAKEIPKEKIYKKIVTLNDYTKKESYIIGEDQ
jgi:CxxC motif-containing protein